MSGRRLLLVAAFVNLATCQQRPQVLMFPPHQEVFSGDLFYLTCVTNAMSGINWYFNGKQQSLTSETWKFPFALRNHSGIYECESNGQKSNTLSINILEYSPVASLTIATGQPVMMPGHSVQLQLENEDGLTDWRCKVYRREKKEMKSIKLKLDSNERVTFQTKSLNVPETIFWCIGPQNNRSNQVVVRTSDKDVSLEMYPLPAVVGESVTLKCIVWGTDQISNTVFYKDNDTILNTRGSSYEINSATESNQGQYSCRATYKHRAQTSGTPHQRVSDAQEMFLREHHIKAVVSESNGLSCSCPLCHTGHTYNWYYKSEGEQWKPLGLTSNLMTPELSGTYACRGVWSTGKSFLSNFHYYRKSSTINWIVVLFCILASLVMAGVAVWFLCLKRNVRSEPIYEDVALGNAEGRGAKYEQLRKRPDDQQQAEYDILLPTSSEKREGSNQSPKVGEGKYEQLRMGPDAKRQAEYDTLAPTSSEKKDGDNPSPKVGEGKYEALQRGPDAKRQAEYETLTLTSSEKKEGVNPSPKVAEHKYEALQRGPDAKRQAEYETLTPTSGEKKEGVNPSPKVGEHKYEALQRGPDAKQQAEYETLTPTRSSENI